MILGVSNDLLYAGVVVLFLFLIEMFSVRSERNIMSREIVVSF